MKRTFSTELAYVFGIVFVARGVVLMEKADFGVSMVVAPAYLLYRWLSPVWSFVTFGMAEYCLQVVLLLAMCLLLRFRVSYLFSFVTAVVYGFVLDAFILLGAALPAGSVWLKILLSLANGQNEADCHGSVTNPVRGGDTFLEFALKTSPISPADIIKRTVTFLS